MEDDPFEKFLQNNGFLLEIIGIFAAISILFSSNIVDNNNSFLQVVSFASLLVILLLSSIIIANLFKSVLKIDLKANGGNKTQVQHLKNSYKIVPFMIFAIALFFIDTGILIYILSTPPMNELFVIIMSMIIAAIYIIGFIFLPIHESLMLNSLNVKIIASIIYGFLLILVIHYLINYLTNNLTPSMIIVGLISIYGIYDTWKIRGSVQKT